jgi:hypothetical protein
MCLTGGGTKHTFRGPMSPRNAEPVLRHAAPQIPLDIRGGPSPAARRPPRLPAALAVLGRDRPPLRLRQRRPQPVSERRTARIVAPGAGGDQVCHRVRPTQRRRYRVMVHGRRRRATPPADAALSRENGPPDHPPPRRPLPARPHTPSSSSRSSSPSMSSGSNRRRTQLVRSSSSLPADTPAAPPACTVLASARHTAR